MNRREFIVGVLMGAVSGGQTGCCSSAVCCCKGSYLPVFRALTEIAYSRWCGLELANAFLDPSELNPGANPSWIPQSLGYFSELSEVA